MEIRPILLVAGCLALVSHAVRGETLRVPEQYGVIQDAIDSARDGDSVVVSPGEYRIDAPVDFKGKAITLRATTGPGETILRMAENPADPDSASVVAFRRGEGPESVIVGFTVTEGKGSLWVTENRRLGGGGIFVASGTSPRVENCVITGNTADAGGGILVTRDAAPAIENCIISENRAAVFGGGVLLFESAGKITRCMIRGNTAGPDPIFGQGGGIWSGLRSSTTIEECEIENNWATGDGGGIHCQLLASPVFRRCSVEHNGAPFGGGVSCIAAGTARFLACRIVGNIAPLGSGGGVYLSDTILDRAPTFSGCTIGGNSARLGGAVACENALADLLNCVIAGNSAEQSGGALHLAKSSSPLLLHCTVTENRARGLEGGVRCADNNSSPRVYNSIVWRNLPESACGNLTGSVTDRDPLFRDPGEYDFTSFLTVAVGGRDRLLPSFIVRPGDFQLKKGSPAMDAAELGLGVEIPPDDFLGNPRICGELPDSGAHEFPAAECGAFVRGEVEVDGKTNLADAVSILNYLFVGGVAPACLKAADSNDDGLVNLTDAVFLLGYLFLGGNLLPPPFEKCGLDDDTPDGLTCDVFEPCR